MALTIEKINDIEKRLEAADREIDSIIQKFYAAPGAQNMGGNIGEISRLHAQLVGQLSEEKRKLLTKDKKQGK
jgi:hypothetical protein